MGFTKLRGYVWVMCQLCMPNGSTCWKGRGKCKESFTSVPRKGILGLPHREEVLVWEMTLVMLLLPHIGYGWAGELPCVPLWHQVFGVAWPGCWSCVQHWVFCPHSSRCFPGTSVTSCTLMSGFWEPTGKCLFPPLAWHSFLLVLP